ncbi:K02A2.6-like [Cordylochernes scorpioides]|uniref:RNA-directed DNA polymerase n=1 Tax=Cordylochernes scorpioides TaxID=51811 RepID=A0ABY6KKZ1_9ARAC|nr:K02A2.6-like [Cordylochernes scorpioides]
MIEQTHNQVPQEPTTDSTVAASLRTLTLCLDQLLNRESEETITHDGDEPAAHFFSQLESQPNFHNLEPARQARKALSSLRGEPRKIAQDLALLNKTYEEVKESLCSVYPRRPSFTLQEFYELKCTSMAEIETYYKNKVRIGLAINLPKSAIVQALSNGVPPLKLPNNDHRAIAEHLPPPWTRPHHILAVTVADNIGTHSVSSEGHTSGLFGPLHLRSTASSNPKDRLGLQVSTRPQQRRAREKPSNASFGSRTPPKLNEPTCTLNQHTPVISLRPYRTPYAYQKEIQDQISQLLKHDIITPSSSPYSSPVTLVRKRDNTMLLCIDFRRVNELVPSDLHPLPLIETVLDNLSKARVFSTVDISNAYYQIPIAEESQQLLSFVTQQGQYNFKRLPFGFKSAPQIFERVITQLIHKHDLSFIAHYYDDFVIFSDSSEQHLTHLRLFFKFCLEENLQLNLKKCNFYQNEIEFLGYHITAGTYTPNIKNTEIINAIRTPINVKTLQSFLGAVNVYHKFIPEYARLRHPLNQLLKKNAKWLWSPNCQQAFDKLKQHLATQPVLHLFQEGLPCQVYCDASTQGIAGVLKQVHPDGNIYPVQYYSRALRSYERNYTISELECLAIVECVDKFRVYLLGTRFVIYSDHHALQWLKTIKDPAGRLFRWSLRLSAYDYEVKYLKGSRQYEADLLSRNPFCGFLSTGRIKDHQGELRRDTRYILNDKDLMTIIRRGVTKIIVPPSLRGTLLQRAHRDFNHPGISQMTRLIAAQYYWDGMTNDIRTHVRTCSVCQLVKPPKGPIYVLPYELVSLDTISGFAKYGNSQTCLHVVVDHATRYAWAFPSRSTSILTYTQVIKKVMQFGSPKRLLMDRAPAFTSPKFRRFLIRHNIGQLLTTSNNPQANGLSSFPLQLSEHVQNYPKIDDARELAYQRTHERHLRDKARFDQTHRASDFEVGDLVLAKTYHHPDTGKLAPFFSGPYEILEIISPQIVRINRPNRPLFRETDTIHVNKLKHYTENEQFISPPVVSHLPNHFGHIPPPQQPFDLISIDTIAGILKYGHSKTYLHVIVDHLTRYAWTFPSKSTSTLTYIQTLKTVLQQGFPKRLLSDRAPAFTSEKFRKFLITQGIQPLLTTSNNPQANGLIERLNATITGKLRLAYLENPKASWTQLVKRVTQTYNNTPHPVTSFPPTYLMFNVIPPDLRTHLNPYPEINIAREIARSQTQNKHKKDKETFDKQHRTPHFEVNDLVLVKNYRHPDTDKLAPYFTGPYTIIEIISPNVVRIDLPNQPLNRDSDTIHVNKLKYYTENVLTIPSNEKTRRLTRKISDSELVNRQATQLEARRAQFRLHQDSRQDDQNEEGKKTVQIEVRKSEDGGTSTPYQRNDQAISSPKRDIYGRNVAAPKYLRRPANNSPTSGTSCLTTPAKQAKFPHVIETEEQNDANPVKGSPPST